jgi:hypothetical protein
LFNNRTQQGYNLPCAHQLLAIGTKFPKRLQDPNFNHAYFLPGFLVQHVVDAYTNQCIRIPSSVQFMPVIDLSESPEDTGEVGKKKMNSVCLAGRGAVTFATTPNGTRHVPVRLTAAEKLAREKKKRVELLLHCYRPSTKVKALEAERAAVADAVGVFLLLFIYNRMTEYLTKISVLFFH